MRHDYPEIIVNYFENHINKLDPTWPDQITLMQGFLYISYCNIFCIVYSVQIKLSLLLPNFYYKNL